MATTKKKRTKKKPTGQKHLIECNCILPQYKNRADPVFHKFIVFSVINPNDTVEPKIVGCPVCGIVHTVTEIGVSEITAKENSKAVRTIDDVRYSLPSEVSNVLDANNCDFATWEEAEFIIENKLWSHYVILSYEQMEENTNGKILNFKGPGMLKVEAFSRQDTFRINI